MYQDGVSFEDLKDTFPTDNPNTLSLKLDWQDAQLIQNALKSDPAHKELCERFEKSINTALLADLPY